MCFQTMDASNSEHVTLFPEGRLHFADLNWFETLNMPAVQGFVDHMLRFSANPYQNEPWETRDSWLVTGLKTKQQKTTYK